MKFTILLQTEDHGAHDAILASIGSLLGHPHHEALDFGIDSGSARVSA